MSHINQFLLDTRDCQIYPFNFEFCLKLGKGEFVILPKAVLLSACTLNGEGFLLDLGLRFDLGLLLDLGRTLRLALDSL